MTPCEELGYKVGDEFEVINTEEGFQSGQVVTLFMDDKSALPLFKGKNTRFNHADGEGGAFMNIGNVRPVSRVPITQKLAHAVKKRDKHRAKLDKWTGEVERWKGELEREVEEATALPCSIGSKPPSERVGKLIVKCNFADGGYDALIEVFQDAASADSIPEGVDPDDPKTWKEGDVIVCIESAAPCHCVTVGDEYAFDGLREYSSGTATSVSADDDGDANWCGSPSTGFSKFRFVRRPSEG